MVRFLPANAFWNSKVGLELIRMCFLDRQKMIAEFWAPLDPYYVNPAVVWFMFAHDAARVSELSLERTIKLLFLVSNGLHDAGIAAWDAKRFFNRSSQKNLPRYEIVPHNFLPFIQIIAP
jgi:hypothetical protein